MTGAPVTAFDAAHSFRGWATAAGRYRWDHRRKPHVHPRDHPVGPRAHRGRAARPPLAAGAVVRREVRRRRQLLGGVAGRARPGRLGGAAPRRLASAGGRRLRRATSSGSAPTASRSHCASAADSATCRSATTPTPSTGTSPCTRDAAPSSTAPFTGTWGGYSGLALRGRADWHDTRLLLDDGAAPGHRVASSARGGATSPAPPTAAGGRVVLDHPANPAHPVPVLRLCRAGEGYGDGWANTVYPAFLWDGPLTLAVGDPLRFRYRVVVHDGAWDAARSEAAWAAYAASAG